ncbi:carbonic anhydrase [Roseococcus sp.]|uniref:carbonic anhydrase n=1 Tax=Roseococcus sp. TaxID=2109646 RepID=UPI003BAC9479
MTTLSSRRGCACCLPTLGRRGIFGLAAGAMLAPMAARAEDGTAYDSMLLTCIDPRFITPVNAWMGTRGLTDKFSRFGIAGAAVGVVAPAFATWHTAFWDNLGASIQLHKITRVIAVAHRDCGAAAIAYGDASIATPEAETALHTRVYGEFKAEVAKRQPSLRVEGGLMALDGKIEMFA